MTKPLTVAAAVAATGLSLSGIPVAFAGSDNETNDAVEQQALMAAKISAGDAIAAALSSHPGKVVELRFDVGDGAPAYEVSIVGRDGMEQAFRVSADSGQVTQVADNADRENGDAEDRDGDHDNGGNDDDSDNEGGENG